MLWWIVCVDYSITDVDVVVGECWRGLSLCRRREGHRPRRRWEACGKEAGQTRPLGLGLWIWRTQWVGRSVKLRSAGCRPQLRTHQFCARHQRSAGHRRPTDHRSGRETRAVPSDRWETRAVPRAHWEARPGARRPPSAIPGQGAGQDPGRSPCTLSSVRATARARPRQRTSRAWIWYLRLWSRPWFRLQQQLRDPPLIAFLYAANIIIIIYILYYKFTHPRLPVVVYQ